MEKLKVMVVDDESRMRKLVRDFLVRQDFDVIEAGDGEQAVDLFFEEKDIALIILDVMMPKMDGWQVCREIRKHSKVPIIMLTARGDEQDELLGFELGVDEYISKPFSPKILVARVEAILRRTNAISSDSVITAGILSLDKAAHQVKVDGQEVELSFKEFELLSFLAKYPNQVFKREELLDKIWGYEFVGDTRTVDVHIKRLREKMQYEDSWSIKTVWGVGYKFEVKNN